MRGGIGWMACLGLVLAGLPAGAEVNTGSLVLEMTDLARLAKFPEPAYATVQFSSFDHRSTTPGGPEWFANGDGFGSEPVPAFEAVLKPQDGETPGEYLVCDVEGPGAIVRVWTARIAGTVRMYLDGASEPVFDGPAEQFFMRPYDAWKARAGFEPELLENTFYQRNAAYCPIPFAQRCRIVWSGKLSDTHFYHLEVRKYAAGTMVKTFAPDDLKTYAEACRATAATLREPDAGSSGGGETWSVELGPGERKETWRAVGAGAIRWLKLRVEAAQRDLALRQTILHGVFDNYPWGQVQSPVGDFFGAAPGVNPYVSLPFTVGADGQMVSRFVMPYQESAALVFENLGEQTVTVHGALERGDEPWDPARSMHFRARWRIDHGLTGDGARPFDVPFVLAQGAGVLVGAASHVLNPNNVPSPHGSWWGEGDEKIFADDFHRPAFFGTGSEDYYNYAWSAGDIFIYPYCGQPVNTGPANRGFVTNYRWHILDPVPFHERLGFYMELFPHERNENMAYARIAYHYGRPGMMDEHMPVTREDVRGQVLPEGWLPAGRLGADRSRFFQAENQARSQNRHAMEEDPMWAGGRVYRWQPERVGEELEFALVTEHQAECAIRAAFAMDARSGKISARIDGEPLDLGGGAGGVLDLHTPDRVLLRTFGGRPRVLAAGHHVLSLRYEGGPEGGGVGIDFLWLQE